MRKISKQDYPELAVFLMDYHGGQWSRGYRLFCRLRVENLSSRFCNEMRQGFTYQYLVERYGTSV